MFTALGLLYPDVKITVRQPLAQAVLESANFTSHNWEINNNCFGMRPPVARVTTCTNKGSSAPYAHYDSALDCIQDWFLFCRALGLTDDALLDNYIKSGKYAADKAYYGKVQANIKALVAANKYINPALILGTGLVTTAGITTAAVYAISDIINS